MTEISRASFFIRQTASFMCAGTLAWDYYRDPSVLESFSLWALALHFIYFQLPLKSRAIAYFHPTSLIGAGVMPLMYAYLLFWNPGLELRNMEEWDLSLSTITARSFLIHVAPLLFHTLDITINQEYLISSYRSKPSRIIMAWSVVSFPLLGLLFELTYPETPETTNLVGITREEFLYRSKVLGFFGVAFSFCTLYLLVICRAYYHGVKPIGSPNLDTDSDVSSDASRHQSITKDRMHSQ